ncbi:MAG TPA: hypothetical protein VF733_06260 [Candidatus Saccharimonadales bacterium]
MAVNFIITLITAAVVSSSAFFLFPQANLFSEQIQLALRLFAFIIQTLALVIFIANLKAFKTELIAVCILLFSIILMQIPISFTQTNRLALTWLIAGIAVFGALIISIAARKFAANLAIRTFYTSPLFAAATVVILVLISISLPHPPLPLSETTVDGILACFVAVSTLQAINALIALRIRARLGSMYKAAVGWFAAALFAVSFACVHEVATKLLSVSGGDYFASYLAYGFASWPFLLTALLFLRTSFSFQEIRVLSVELPGNASLIEVIRFVTGMVSNPIAIDVTLDKMRQITATKNSEETLSTEETTVLRSVYLEIEKYLITKEPLHKFTKADLRSRLPKQFLQTLPKG